MVSGRQTDFFFTVDAASAAISFVALAPDNGRFPVWRLRLTSP